MGRRLANISAAPSCHPPNITSISSKLLPLVSGMQKYPQTRMNAQDPAESQATLPLRLAAVGLMRYGETTLETRVTK